MFEIKTHHNLLTGLIPISILTKIGLIQITHCFHSEKKTNCKFILDASCHFKYVLTRLPNDSMQIFMSKISAIDT